MLLSTLKILKSPAANAASADPLAKLPYIGTITFFDAIKFEKSLQYALTSSETFLPLNLYPNSLDITCCGSTGSRLPGTKLPARNSFASKELLITIGPVIVYWLKFDPVNVILNLSILSGDDPIKTAWPTSKPIYWSWEDGFWKPVWYENLKFCVGDKKINPPILGVNWPSKYWLLSYLIEPVNFTTPSNKSFWTWV